MGINQSRIYVISVFFTYSVSCLVGIIIVQSGNSFALSYRDKIVGKALETDKASINYNKGNNFFAALNDLALLTGRQLVYGCQSDSLQ